MQSTSGSSSEQLSETESGGASVSDEHSEEEEWTGFGMGAHLDDEGHNDDQSPANGAEPSSNEPTGPTSVCLSNKGFCVSSRKVPQDNTSPQVPRSSSRAILPFRRNLKGSLVS